MFKERILENKRRNEIYAIVKKNPGLHIRQIQRITGIPFASLEYHLSYMTKRNLILEEKSEHYTRYYVRLFKPEDQRILLALRQARLREIVMILLASKKAKYKFIVQTLSLPPSTVSFYLKSLLDNNIIEKNKIGYENVYKLRDECRVERILIAYQSSFLDKLADKWISTWYEHGFVVDRSKEEEP